MVRSRDEVEEKYKWAVDQIYGEGEVEEEINQVNNLLEKIKGYRGDLKQESELEEFLKNYSRCRRKLSTLSRYASMKSDEDTRDQEAQALKSRINSLSSKVSEETSFVRIEIQEIGEDKIGEMIDRNDEIAKRDHYLREILRLKPHTRSLEVEETISSLSEVLDAPSETYSMLSNADIKFPEVDREGEKVRITNSNFTKLLKDSNQNFRREVYDKYYETLENYENTIGTTFSKEIRSNVKLAELKNYSSARESALKPNNIPLTVYDNLIETVNENLDVLHSHMELKAEARNLEKPGMEDLYLPIPESEGPEITYEEAKEHILEALKPLGEEYVEKAREGLENRWVDVYETEGKRSGAYSGGSYDTRPFILMNYQNDINSMFTLAHELGHSMHSQLTSENQPYLHSSYKIFVAEVASTVNEALLTDYLLENVDDPEFRKHVLSHSLENFRSTLFRQTMFADFEQKIHEKAESGEAITPEVASEIYGDLKSNFYEPVEMDDHIENEWMRIPHFYYSFYVFQYATGISAANRIKELIKEEGPEKYLEFLKSGGSAPPLELLSKTGVNMEDREPVKAAIENYRERVEQMREEIK
ncbi:MAG: oligoendopeptidase F [Candidatus Nanohaloarchaea archaeon]|jgi:oligoendopeptidase F